MPTLKQGAITTTVVITAMRCPTCGVHYGLDEDFRQRALEDSNRGWYCTKCDFCRLPVAERVKVARWLVCPLCASEYAKAKP